MGEEMKRCGVKIATIQETRWKGQGIINKKHFSMRYSGKSKME